MNNSEKELLKAVLRQVTDNVPKLYIQDINSGRVFEYGKNCHDKLLISEDGRCLTYYNLQDGDGSCVGDYRFYYEKPKIETEEDKRYAYDIDEWARMVKHQSISELLAEERKKVIERIRDLAEIYTEPSAKGFDFETYILTEENLNKILDKVERWGGEQL